MNKAPTKKKSAEAISEEHTFTAFPVDSQDVCLAAGQPRETIIHVKIKLPVGGAEKLCLPAATDHMASLDLTKGSTLHLRPYRLATLVSRLAGSHGYQRRLSCFLISARRFPLQCELSQRARQDSSPSL
ncbi:hypothetical protein E2C01_017660 [Portunus trituberculatus]|uniref:Uncharacterized protein n=1 Tax=Portunus trituberculatus TaxID=210409 RepID=A0A5B7DTH0_PORTR|nr:hypothetical protein [Portunus trituberculatus]